MSVTVNGAGSTFEAGAPRELFDSGFYNINSGHTGNYHPYAVSPDGQRFLIPRPTSNLKGEILASPITVVVNWTAALRKK